MSFLVLTTRLKKSYDIGPVLLPSRTIALQGNCRVWIRTSNPFKKPEILLQAAHDAWLKFENFTEERSEEHTSELQSQSNLVCRLLLEKKKKKKNKTPSNHKKITKDCSQC